MKFTGMRKQLALLLLRTLDSQALHAGHLGFEHPATHEKLSFQSDLPENFRKAVEILEAHNREISDVTT